MSEVERMATLSDADLLDMIGPLGSVQRMAAMALALRSVNEGSLNTREALEHSGRFKTLGGPAT